MQLIVIIAEIIVVTMLPVLASNLAKSPLVHQKPSTGSLNGQVYDAHFGRPVESANVQVYSRGTVIGSAVTGHEGRYSIRGLPEGEISIEVQFPGFVRLRQTARIRAFEDAPLDLCLEVGLLSDPPERLIRGEVLDSNRNAIEGARVVVTNPFTQAVVARATTDKAGRYGIRIHRTGQHVMIVHKPGFSAEVATFMLNAFKLNEADRSQNFVLQRLPP